jgi:HEAT repeat protein
MVNIFKKLQGGDRRSIGKVQEVLKDVSKDPSQFEILIQGMLHEDPLIRMRAADAVEKFTAKHPEYLHPHKQIIIQQISKLEQQEVRWHVAQIFPRLMVTDAEKKRIIKILQDYLQDKSKIVVTFALQALSDFGAKDPILRHEVRSILSHYAKTGSPAIKNRATKLLNKMNKLYT